MTEIRTDKPIERLFPFALRARILIVGRQALERMRKHLQFVLVTDDVSERSRDEILHTFRHCPIVQRYTSTEIEEFFGFRGTKVVGFKKSDLARSLNRELKLFRIHQPALVPPRGSSRVTDDPNARVNQRSAPIHAPGFGNAPSARSIRNRIRRPSRPLAGPPPQK